MPGSIPINGPAPPSNPGGDWLPAMALNGSPNKPALCTNYYEYQMDLGGGPPDTELRPRSIPLLRESFVPAARLAESFRLDWRIHAARLLRFSRPGRLQLSSARIAP